RTATTNEEWWAATQRRCGDARRRSSFRPTCAPRRTSTTRRWSAACPTTARSRRRIAGRPNGARWTTRRGLPTPSVASGSEPVTTDDAVPSGQPVTHVPVLADEVMAMLAPAAGSRQVDATLGGGGHAERIIEATDPDG